MDLKPLKWGPGKLRAWSEAVVEAIKRNRPISGNGTTVDDGPNGRPVNITDQGQAQNEEQERVLVDIVWVGSPDYVLRKTFSDGTTEDITTGECS